MKLVHCLSQIIVPPPSLLSTTCTVSHINHVLKINLEYCQEPKSLTFRIDGQVQAAYNASTTESMVKWIKQCAVRACSMTHYKDRDDCPFVSLLNSNNYICFNSTYHVNYMVLGRVQLFPRDSLYSFNFIAYGIQ